jgi:hypothetical protein
MATFRTGAAFVRPTRLGASLHLTPRAFAGSQGELEVALPGKSCRKGIASGRIAE